MSPRLSLQNLFEKTRNFKSFVSLINEVIKRELMIRIKDKQCAMSARKIT